jgi:hypothetical protein
MKRLLVGALVLAGSIGNAQASTITFEDHAVGSGVAVPALGDLTSGGFFFDTASDVYQLANNSAKVDDGSTYLVTEGNQPRSAVTFSQTSGAAFALTSFDYAEWQSDIPGSHSYPTTITVTGTQVGGNILTATFSLDGIFDGPGGASDFQTATFVNWTNLSSVTLLGTGSTTNPLNYFAVDNIVVDTTAVPEPATLTLLGLGSACLIRRRRGAIASLPGG